MVGLKLIIWIVIMIFYNLTILKLTKNMSEEEKTPKILHMIMNDVLITVILILMIFIK